MNRADHPQPVNLGSLFALLCLLAAIVLFAERACADEPPIERMDHPTTHLPGAWLPEDAVLEYLGLARERPHLVEALRIAHEREADWASERLTLRATVASQSDVIREIRELASAARPWLPGWAYWLLGIGSAGVAGVVLALSL